MGMRMGMGFCAAQRGSSRVDAAKARGWLGVWRTKPLARRQSSLGRSSFWRPALSPVMPLRTWSLVLVQISGAITAAVQSSAAKQALISFLRPLKPPVLGLTLAHKRFWVGLNLRFRTGFSLVLIWIDTKSNRGSDKWQSMHWNRSMIYLCYVLICISYHRVNLLDKAIAND